MRENLATMREAIDQYHGDTGQWPESIEVLVDKRYLRAVPVDPITESDRTWVEVAPPEGTGVQDVRSGAEGAGLDGIPYAEW